MLSCLEPPEGAEPRGSPRMGWAPRRLRPAGRTARTGGAPRAPIGSRRASVGRWPFSGPGPCTPRSRARGRVGSSGCRGGCVRAPRADGGSGRRRQPTMRGAGLCSPASRAGSWPRSGSCPTTRRRSTPSSRKRAHLCFRSRPLQDCATAIDAELRTVGYWNSQPGLEMRQRQSL